MPARIFFVCPGLPFFVVLELYIAADSVSFQIYQVLFTAVAAVGGNCLQDIPECSLMLFQNRNQHKSKTEKVSAAHKCL